MDGTHKTAFRKWFSYIGELRSICPSATLLVLRFRSLEETEFKSTDIREITLSLSINLRISEVSNEVEIAMTWLIYDLNAYDLKENFSRIIIYCNSITDYDTSNIYTYITFRMFKCHEYSDYHRIERHKQ